MQIVPETQVKRQGSVAVYELAERHSPLVLIDHHNQLSFSGRTYSGSLRFYAPTLSERKAQEEIEQLEANHIIVLPGPTLFKHIFVGQVSQAVTLITVDYIAENPVYDPYENPDLETDSMLR